MRLNTRRLTTRLLQILVACQLVLAGTGPKVTLAGQKFSPELIEKAKQEGQVVWYATFTLTQAQNWAAHFTKKYGIKVAVIKRGSNALTQTVQNEAAFGKWRFDAYLNHNTQLEYAKSKGWVQKMDYDEAKRFGSAGFYDPEGYWVGFFLQPWVIAYNTNLIDPREAPKSYEDLLNPKWKGKIAFDEQDVDLYATLLKTMGPEKGPQYMKRLAAQNLLMHRGHGKTTTLLGAGEFPIYASAFVSVIEVKKMKGLESVDWVAPEPVPISIRALGLSAKPPHPNAAKLFFHWALSKEGQQLLDDMGIRIPARRDVKFTNDRLKALFDKETEPVDPHISENYKKITDEFRRLFMQ